MADPAQWIGIGVKAAAELRKWATWTPKDFPPCMARQISRPPIHIPFVKQRPFFIHADFNGSFTVNMLETPTGRFARLIPKIIRMTFKGR